MRKPPKKHVQKWIDALRSGEFKQTKGLLQNSQGHCCLGVACEVFIPKNNHRRIYSDGGPLRGDSPLDQPLAPQWLKSIETDFEDRTEGGTSIVEMNDDMDMTFDEIADVLQAVYIEDVLG